MLTYTFTTGGLHSITAAFSGVDIYTPSTASQDINVTVPVITDLPTVTELTVPSSGSTSETVVLMAKVSAAQTPTGTVQFFDGDKPLGEAVTLVNGYASLTYTFIDARMHTIIAKYSGAQGFTASSSVAGSVLISALPSGVNNALDAGSATLGSLNVSYQVPLVPR
jgi:hypothetical protein